MIMAVMGLTLGTMFFVVNPNLALAPNPKSDTRVGIVLNEDFNFLSSFPNENRSFTQITSKIIRYSSEAGWNVTYSISPDERSDNWKLSFSAKDSDNNAVIGDENIKSYVLRIRELRGIVSF